MFYAMKDGKLTPFSPAANRKISDGGIDTIYVTIPFDEMDVNPVETVMVNVKGSTWNRTKRSLRLRVELRYYGVRP